ncbi:MAG: heme exporter protein [Actinomycetota bacterium]|jgi:heme ABC exporter ATP-binding subunit CcmA|nr:heme exporter protein [Actinomycetota bacterium]
MEKDESETEIASGTANVIQIRSLNVFFGRTVALDHVDLDLEPGVVGLFGQNASGKSTLLRVLAGLLQPTSGWVTWDGTPVNSSGEELRARIGYAGHSSGLYLKLSIRENLALFARLYGVAPKRVDIALDVLGLAPHAATPVGRLSAGFKRRAGVARALLHEPDLLLLDEPYAHLDDEASEAVSEAIRSWRAPARTAVIATHGAKRIKQFIDTRVVLQRGRVVTQLDAAALAARTPV